MATIAPIDILILGVRLIFAALLYTAVLAILLALRQTLATEQPGGRPAAPPPARAVLSFLESSPADRQTGRRVELTNGLTIGRRAPCDVVLRDDAVSARHARFQGYDGQWEVEDLGSTNGTFVNGRRLSAPAPLQPGDVVSIGTAALRFGVEE